MMRSHLLLAVVIAALLAACGSSSAAKPAGPSATEHVTLHLGYFPNFTHAQAIVGLARGTFRDRLGQDVTLEPKTFNAGPDEITALFAGQIDVAYIGPSPAVNGYLKSKGSDVRIIAGAVDGGAALVVRNDAMINRPADFAGRKVASPQLGNTQDVALRTWLRANGLNAREQGGSVTVIALQNADALTAMQKGEIDAAWAPEPWATRLVQEAGGHMFVDERTLWPGGTFPTAVVIVRTKFLEQHPDVVKAFLRAHVETTSWIRENPDAAKQLVNDGLRQLIGKALSQNTIDAAWKMISVTNDPAASAIDTGADHAAKLGFLNGSPDLRGLFALDPLNAVLSEQQIAPVSTN